MPMRLALRTAPVDFVGLGAWTVVDLWILEKSLPKILFRCCCPFEVIREGMGDFALDVAVVGIWLARLARRLGVRRILVSRAVTFDDEFAAAVLDRVERVRCGAGPVGGFVIDAGVGMCDARFASLEGAWPAMREDGLEIEVSVEDLLCCSIPAVGCNRLVLWVDSWLAGRGGNGIWEVLLLPRK